MTFDTFLLFVLLLIQALDAYTTRWGIKRGAYEDNPVPAGLQRFLAGFTNARWAWLAIAKAVGVGASILAYNAGGLEFYVASTLILALYTKILINNFKVMERVRG